MLTPTTGDQQLRFVTTLALLTTVVAHTAAAQDLDAAADGFCACSAPMLTAVKEALALGDASGLEAIQAELEKLAPEMEACFEALAKEHPQVAADDTLRQQVEAMANERCPRPNLGG